MREVKQAGPDETAERLPASRCLAGQRPTGGAAAYGGVPAGRFGAGGRLPKALVSSACSITGDGAGVQQMIPNALTDENGQPTSGEMRLQASGEGDPLRGCQWPQHSLGCTAWFRGGLLPLRGKRTPPGDLTFHQACHAKRRGGQRGMGSRRGLFPHHGGVDCVGRHRALPAHRAGGVWGRTFLTCLTFPIFLSRGSHVSHVSHISHISHVSHVFHVSHVTHVSHPAGCETGNGPADPFSGYMRWQGPCAKMTPPSPVVGHNHFPSPYHLWDTVT